MKGFRLPRNDQRLTVIGRTGSGKTVFGVWSVAIRDFMKHPWVFVDYKGDDLLRQIPRLEEIGLDEVPKHGGLYIVRPEIHESEAMEGWLWRVWRRGRVGLYFDEAFMLPNSGHHRRGALQAILTQGRSKKIPVVSLVQRPSQISVFVFSEAEFYAVFHLNRLKDKQTVQGFADKLHADLIGVLPDYHSWWYDVGQDTHFRMLPAPAPDTVAEMIDMKLRPKRRFLNAR